MVILRFRIEINIAGSQCRQEITIRSVIRYVIYVDVFGSEDVNTKRIFRAQLDFKQANERRKEQRKTQCLVPFGLV